MDNESPFREDSNRDHVPSTKRKRLFIARNACQACRTKKTKCDEDSPCSQCRLLGIECIYSESRGFSVIMAAIKRIETKIDAKLDCGDSTTDTGQERRCSEARHSERPMHSPWRQPRSASTHGSPSSHVDAECVKLSFSAHRIMDWALQMTNLGTPDQPLHLESDRSILPPNTAGSLNECTPPWLSSLSLSNLKRLCDLYFHTFNRTAPILDRESFFKTIGVAVETEFGNNIESCLVLTVMALGCFAQDAFEEGGFVLSTAETYRPLFMNADSSSRQRNAMALRFFDEGRRRIGFLLAERRNQSCQYFLLAAAVYAILLRPLEEWAMTSQACAISAAFWLSDHETSDEYEVDLQRRLFWSALMRDTILTDELELPRSSLQSLEGRVALPKFIRHGNRDEARGGPDEYYHCHHLAQIAVRIIMTRIRDELFYVNPSVYLAQELYHQLEQWRSSLPRSIRDDFDSDPITHQHPAQTLAVAVLQGRYWISVYHIGRPFLYKVFSCTPDLTANDLDICRRSIQAAIAWFAAFRRCIKMRSYIHLNFFVCGQLFGQLLITHRLRTATDVKIRSIVPIVVDDWCREAFSFMQEIAPSNPTVARDVDVLLTLFETGPLHADDAR